MQSLSSGDTSVRDASGDKHRQEILQVGDEPALQ